MYFWETVDGARLKDCVDIEYEYYVKEYKNKSDITDIYGNQVSRRLAKSNAEVKQLRESGENLCESDLPQDVKFLQSRYGKLGDIKYKFDDFNIANIDIEVASENNEFPKAEDAKFPINLLSVKINPEGNLYTFGIHKYLGLDPNVKNYCECENEKDLLEKFIMFFRKKHIDIITGWNVIGFDILYILNRCEQLGIEKSISPINKTNKRKNPKTEEWSISIAGISLIDYIDLYKTFTKDKRESYSLNYISIFEVGEGKMEFDGTINNLWKTDWNKFVEYNVQDVILVDKIDKKIRYIDLAISMCLQSLVPIEKYNSSVLRATGSILKHIHQRNMVLPDRPRHVVKEELVGAYVEAKVGYFESCMSLDVESLYPHMLISWNISPETLRLNPKNTEGLIKTPVEGVYYTKEMGIIPSIIQNIFNERREFKRKYKIETDPLLKQYYDLRQYTNKIFLNSIYGVLGNEFFHLYNINNARVVTMGGQDLIKYIGNCFRNYFESYFHLNKKWFPKEDINNKLKNEVLILIDTDSNFLCLDEVYKKLSSKNESFLDWAKKFEVEFLKPFIDKILQQYADNNGIKQVINFRREKIIDKLMILTKKKYSLTLLDDDGVNYDPPKLKIIGIEIVRTSTPSWAREKIKDVINQIFKNPKDKDDIINLLKQYKKEFKNQPIETIAFPRGVSDYKKYMDDDEFKDDEIPKMKSGIPIANRASVFYNYLIQKYKLQYQPISDGSKIKFIYVKEDNLLRTNIIGFVGICPKEFEKMFKIDYDLQYNKCFLSVIQRFFDVLGHGEINFNSGKLDKFME
jgi:DNA polymerase elongation subunit (family B)